MRRFRAQPPPNRLQISARSCEIYTNTDVARGEAESDESWRSEIYPTSSLSWPVSRKRAPTSPNSKRQLLVCFLTCRLSVRLWHRQWLQSAIRSFFKNAV